MWPKSKKWWERGPPEKSRPTVERELDPQGLPWTTEAEKKQEQIPRYARDDRVKRSGTAGRLGETYGYVAATFRSADCVVTI